MTEFQWKVIIVLIKVVLKLVKYHQEGYTEFYSSDTELLKEALDREQ